MQQITRKMTEKMIKVLCICRNSESSIYNTLLSWKDTADEFHILINNTTDRTVDEITRTGLKVNVVFFDFTTFSETRNKLLDYVGDFPGYVIFIDDSYELTNKSLREELLSMDADCVAVRLKRESIVYNRSIIFKSKFRYTGEIHEVPNVLPTKTIRGVIDVIYIDHLLRTQKRKQQDANFLTGNSPRDQYYRACLNPDRTEKIDLLTLYICKYSNKYAYLCCLYLADLVHVNYLLIAVNLQPTLSAEPYFRLYKETNKKCYLEEAHKTCLKMPISDLPIDSSFYGTDGIINICFNHSLVMTEIKNIDNAKWKN